LSGAYFQLGEEENFLLMQLDGGLDQAAVCQAYRKRFNQPLTEEELSDFLELVAAQGFLQAHSAGQAFEPDAGPENQAGESRAGKPDVPAPAPQSLLYWRKNIFDPDRLFTWLAPKLWFFWTRTFLFLSTGCILLAGFVLWVERQEVATSFVSSLRWQTAVWAWLMLGLVTLLHESAHGLTCKHYGGEVHEIGFLSLFFMPCFYCNVSDAWLFKGKSKRLWVSFAGGYFELFLWALAVFVWRLTLPGSLPHYLAFIVAAAC